MKTKIIKRAGLLILLVVSSLRADTVWISGHHEITDGELYGEIYIYNDVTVDIFGGDIYKLETYDVTVTDWYGGAITELCTWEDSLISMYGGQLNRLQAAENSVIQLYAYDVIHHPTGGHYDRGWFEGSYFLNDLYFTFDLISLDTFSHINVVPEPTTVFLLALGALFIRKRK